MKIVIPDGHAVNPGDLGWDALRDLGDQMFLIEPQRIQS